MGVWFNAHPELELRCGGKRVSGEGFYVFDYAQPAAVERWVETFTDAVATGFIDGGFVGESSSSCSRLLSGNGPRKWCADGLATDAGWRSRWLKGCNESYQDKFVAGVSAAQKMVRKQTGLCKMLSSRFFPPCSFVAAQLGEKLGPDRLVFANMGPMRPGDNAQMIEFFKPAANDIQQVRPQTLETVLNCTEESGLAHSWALSRRILWRCTRTTRRREDSTRPWRRFSSGRRPTRFGISGVAAGSATCVAAQSLPVDPWLAPVLHTF